jgi:hypothetical protein
MRNIVPNVKETLMNAEGEAAVIDVLGEIKQVESGLASLRQGSQVEFASGQQGKTWRIVVPSPNERNYNTPRLLQKFSRALDVSMAHTIVWLMQAGALKITWGWQKLEGVARQLDVTLGIASHEIVHGEDADVGVYPKKGYPKYEEVG